MPNKNLEPLVDVVVRIDAEGVNAALASENGRLLDVIGHAHALLGARGDGLEYVDEAETLLMSNLRASASEPAEKESCE